MATNDVKFNIRLQVDGKDRVVQASTSVEQLSTAVEGVKTRVSRGFDITRLADLETFFVRMSAAVAQATQKLNEYAAATAAQ
ncbi:MAG: hypothetical protein ACI3YC_04125, partial [Alloprevotella sp.]